MIVEQLYQNRDVINQWFFQQWSQIEPPFYASVDLRHSGAKLAPVDVNLYPAGFNNLLPEDRQYATQQVKKVLKPEVKNILLVIEQHTRNTYYLENIASLRTLLEEAGYSVKLTMLTDVPQQLTSLSGKLLTIDCVTKKHGYLQTKDFTPDCIILNNDLSEGLPSLLEDLQQPILPPSALGWHQRKKSNYFAQYTQIAQQFATHCQLDAWCIDPLFSFCEAVDLSQVKDQQQVIDTADKLLHTITTQYKAHQIKETPYLIIKADAGSYGMGVLAIEQAKDIATLSRKKRQHMSKTKGNQPIHSVLLQEGIATYTTYNELIAEPVLYFIGQEGIGGFYRTHTKRNQQENLNTPGMQLIPAPFSTQWNTTNNPLLYAYQTIAQLAVLAAAYEIKAAL